MNAKKCDVCGEYYTENNNECGLDRYEEDALTGIKTMHGSNQSGADAWIDLCDGCAEKLAAWITGDAIIVRNAAGHQKYENDSYLLDYIVKHDNAILHALEHQDHGMLEEAFSEFFYSLYSQQP